jgi:macrophage erythroblast attacher
MAQRHIEQAQPKVDELIKASQKNLSANDGGAKSVASLNQAITRLETLKRKLTSLDENQRNLSGQIGARTEHLQELYSIQTLADVKYDQWSRVRLDRLLLDYMLRRGYLDSAKQLATERNMEDLADIDLFESVAKIERSMRVDHRVDLALSWCGENKQNLKKLADVR